MTKAFGVANSQCSPAWSKSDCCARSEEHLSLNRIFASFSRRITLTWHFGICRLCRWKYLLSRGFGDGDTEKSRGRWSTSCCHGTVRDTKWAHVRNISSDGYFHSAQVGSTAPVFCCHLLPLIYEVKAGQWHEQNINRPFQVDATRIGFRLQIRINSLSKCSAKMFSINFMAKKHSLLVFMSHMSYEGRIW